MCSELEYFPYGLLEPMITNVPIITSRFPGFSEIIEEETECLAFEPKNHKELAEKIINLIENKEKRAKIKQNAYTKVTQVYNWESVAKHYAEMYKSLI